MTAGDESVDVPALQARVQDLKVACEQLRLERADLLEELEASLRRIEAAEIDLRPMYEALERAEDRAQELERRAQTLELRLTSANQLAASAHKQLLAERAWASDQARAVAASQSWRVGHGLVRVARALGLRGDQGADALTVIIRRMEDRATDVGAD
jgi:chromosome segregation ATPase